VISEGQQRALFSNTQACALHRATPLSLRDILGTGKGNIDGGPNLTDGVENNQRGRVPERDAHESTPRYRVHPKVAGLREAYNGRLHE
jgi:hypothetical protein